MSTRAWWKDRLRSGRWFGPLMGGVWLVYLAQPLGAVLSAEGWREPLGVVALVAFVVVYLHVLVINRRARAADSRPRYVRNSLELVVLAGLLLAMIPGAGQVALNAAPFVAATAVMSLPLRAGVAVAAVLVGVVELASQTVPGWQDGAYGFGTVLAAIATFAARMTFLRTQQLVRAEAELAELAIEEERSRIARDLHDILGHSLTVISVKAELADRLLDVDVQLARAEIVQLQQLSRDALRDVRATALGVRGVSLPNEIAQARVALESAGIVAELPTVADNVPTRCRETFAWAVREGVTNVIRHSGARRCVVEMSDRRLVIRDDGVGLHGGITGGQGLSGLRRRVETAGGELSIGGGPGGVGVELVVEVQG